MEIKKLYKSNSNIFFDGVLAGFAEYVEVDPTLIRLIYALLLFMDFGVGSVFYVIAAIIMPRRPKEVRHIKLDPLGVAKEVSRKEPLVNLEKEEALFNQDEVEPQEEVERESYLSVLDEMEKTSAVISKEEEGLNFDRELKETRVPLDQTPPSINRTQF